MVMKKIANIFLYLLISVFVISSCTPEKKYAFKKIKTQKDTISYYMGLTYGKGIKQAEIDSLLDYNAFMKGVTKAIENDTLPVSDFEIQTYLSTFFRELQSKKLETEFKDYMAENKAFLESNAKKDSVKVLPSGLQYKILRTGKGKMPTMMDNVKVHYTGRLIDGTVFDSSYERNEPAEFGVGQVIPGWVEALQLMTEGSKWTVYIPQNLAYGAQAPRGSKIKPFSTLVFDVELLKVMPAGK
jgi:FKBP-type peptidyl-prolyl cis-trans isomerase